LLFLLSIIEQTISVFGFDLSNSLKKPAAIFKHPISHTQPNPTFFSFFHLDFHLEVLGYVHWGGNPTQTPRAQNPETPMEIQMEK